MFLNHPYRRFIRSLAAVCWLATGLTCFAQQPAKTYVVKEGAFPWFDRVNQWALSGVPESLLGTTPVPQQACSERSLVLTGTPAAIVFAVQDNDVAKFKAAYPTATPTGEKLAIKKVPAGDILGYTVFSWVNPPQKIKPEPPLGAGLILLKVSDTGAPVPTTSTAVPAVPAVAPAAVPPATGAGVPLASRQPFVLPGQQNVDLYLLMGQSNMVGRDIVGLDAQATDPRIGFIDSQGQWWIAREPMHSGGSGIGPGISFATTMLPSANPASVIGLIPCAVGGTPLSRWVKGRDLYQAAVSRAKKAAAAGRLKGILWHQGESDSQNAADAQSYEVRLTQMFKDIRADLGQPDLPIVVGQLGEFVQARYVEIVRIALTHLPADLPRVGFADSKGLGHKGDSLHFSAEAEQEMGRRYAAALKAIP